MPTRCSWPRTELDVHYHDTEWCVPVRDDHTLFELLTLEGAQSGLSWSIVLAKREGYRRAFAGFDPSAVARFTPARVARLLKDPSIVRHRGKIESTIVNARAVMAAQQKFGSFAALLWRFVGGSPIVHHWSTTRQIPAQTPHSRAMSKDLKQRGFAFIDPTTSYALMQAAGMVNDHLVTCFRHKDLS